MKSTKSEGTKGSREKKQVDFTTMNQEGLNYVLDDPVAQKNKTITVRFGSAIPKEQLKINNKVRTTKYTALSWAPLSLIY